MDSILQEDFLIPGETANITIEVYGGATSQEIDNIDLKLCCQYIDEEAQDNDGEHNGRNSKVKRTFALAGWKLPYAFTIEPGQQRDFQVELDVPWNTPVTIGDAKVWLETGLDISMAVDPTDKDMLTVRPDPLMDAVLTELEEQGLRIRQVECEATNGFALPFVQEFEFVPISGPYHGRWRELEIVAYRHEDVLELWFEIDRQKQGFGGMLSSLLGAGKLQRHLEIPSHTPLNRVGSMVLDYLESSG